MGFPQLNLSFVRGGATGDTGSTAPVTPEQRVLEMLDNLQGPVGPTPPAPLGVGRRVLGAIGDAMTAQATVRAGGVPPRTGAFAEFQQGRQEEFRIAHAEFLQKQREFESELAKVKRELTLASEDRLRKEQNELDKDARLRQRQIEDDEREAKKQIEVAEAKAEIDLKKDIRTAALELRKQGIELGKPLEALTMADILDLSAGAAGVELDPVARLQAQEEAAKAVLGSGAQTRRVSFTGKDGVPNVIVTPDPLAFMSEADKRLIRLSAVPLEDSEGNPRSNEELMEEVRKLQKSENDQKTQLREARLAAIANKDKRPNGTVGAKIAEALTILQNAEAAMLTLSRTSAAPGGPIAGSKWVPPGLRYAVLGTFNQKAADINRDVTVRIQNIFNTVAKIRSGAAVTLPEEIRLVPELPVMTDTKTTMLKKLALLIEFQNRFMDNLQGQHKLEDDDISHVSARLSDPTFIPTELEQGDVVIFGGDP